MLLRVYVCLRVANGIINVKNNEHLGIANGEISTTKWLQPRGFTEGLLLEQSRVFMYA